MQEMKAMTQEEINKKGTELMEKEFVFTTLIKNNNENRYGGNAFVRGKICGYKELICDGERSHTFYKTSEGYILITKCTPDKYVEFNKLVEEHYPGLCKFNYKCDLKEIEMKARKHSLEKQKKEK